ncbi:monomeric sarcosine oxidase-like [Biomphalaria glabrata]|uniref:Monomeric sarcosine oxidase-like n=1 Tax=Biomphalaria glabrata TaxID=6526 RepID=A0A9W2ZUT2_BIOGL|nr:monomeric sarcosine oxidase-like [Biomphalaria glabrata]
MANTLDDLRGKRHFDYIVIGCGGIGSGAVYWLSKRVGKNVLGLEKFNLGHENGGSQDVSRIIRLTYPYDRYLKLTPDTFKTWETVEQESGIQLVYKPGGLTISEKGKTDHILTEYEEAMRRHGIPYQKWNHRQLMEHYPQFTVGPEVEALFQKDAGIVDAAMGNSLHIQLAQGNGATVLDNCPVNKITRTSSGLIEVSTPLANFTCKKVIVAAGAWINSVLSHVGCHVPVYVTQENVTYFGSPHVKEFTKDRFPMFIYHEPGNDIYALPVHGISGTKIGIDAAGPVVTGDTRTWVPDPARLERAKRFLSKTLPKFLGPVIKTKTCLYTMTPDRDFLIDNCAKSGYPEVIVCCGAGHAYKFASLLGKILSELAVDGASQYDISEFSWNREALVNPNFKPAFVMGADKSKL